MSTRSTKSHSGRVGGQTTRPSRALGATERRGQQRTRRESTEPDSGDRGPRVVYWIGDERETTQGDW